MPKYFNICKEENNSSYFCISRVFSRSLKTVSCSDFGQCDPPDIEAESRCSAILNYHSLLSRTWVLCQCKLQWQCTAKLRVTSLLDTSIVSVYQCKLDAYLSFVTTPPQFHSLCTENTTKTQANSKLLSGAENIAARGQQGTRVGSHK